MWFANLWELFLSSKTSKHACFLLLKIFEVEFVGVLFIAYQFFWNFISEVINFHQRRYALHTTQAPKVNKNVSCACSSSSPAMRVASVAAPSVLILTVVLLSVAMCRKMSHYQRKKNEQMKGNVKLKDRGSSEDLDIPQFVATRSTSMSSSEYKQLVSNPYSV